MEDFYHRLLNDLPDEEAIRVRDALVHRRYRPGESILREGEQSEEFCIIASGRVRITCRDRHGSQREIAHLGVGEWFGEMSLITGELASATVEAESEVEVWALPRYVFAVLTAKSPLLLERLCTVLVERLRQTNERLLQARKAEVSLVLSPGDPRWARGFTRALARSLAWHSRQRVVLIELSRQTDGPVSPPWRAHSLQEAVSYRALPVEYEGAVRGPARKSPDVTLITMEDPAPASQVVAALELLQDRYDYALVYAGSDQEFGQAISRSAALVLLAAREDELEAATDVAPFGVGDGRRDISVVVMTEGLSPPSIAEFEQLQKTTPLALHCAIPGGVDAVEALAWEEGRAAPAVEAARRRVDWLARDIAHLKVGLALGAGGSRGYAHLGVLKVLRRCGMPVDVVAGCSIGAPIAAGVAADYTLERIQQHMDLTARKGIRFTLPLRSVLSSRGIIAELRKISGERRFEDLSTPLGFVVVDLLNGEEVLLCRGQGWPAMAASMALPGILPPVRIGHRYLVDGGIVNPVPVSAAVALGADLVVGVKLGASRGQRRLARPPSRILRGPSILDTIRRTLEIMQRTIADTSSSQADITIEPELPKNVSLLDWGHAPELIEAGEKAAEEALPRLRAMMPWLA